MKKKKRKYLCFIELLTALIILITHLIELIKQLFN